MAAPRNMATTTPDDYSDVDRSTAGGSRRSTLPMMPTAKYRPSRSTPPTSRRTTSSGVVRGRSSSYDSAGRVAGLAPRSHLRARTERRSALCVAGLAPRGPQPASSSIVGSIDACSSGVVGSSGALLKDRAISAPDGKNDKTKENIRKYRIS